MNIHLRPDSYSEREPFIFVRHGRTDWSKANITQGPLNLSLNELGRHDAEKAATVINKISSLNHVIITSELTRAKQTAEIIGKKMKRPIHVFPNLHERYYGDFSQYAIRECSPQHSLPCDAESLESFQDRISKAFLAMLKDDKFIGKHKVIVSHSLVFKELSLALIGKQEIIHYGDVFLFIPDKASDAWHLEKIIA